VIALDRIREARREDVPFTWARIFEPFQLADASKLAESFPHSALIPSIGKGDHYQLADLTIVSDGRATSAIGKLPAAWAAIVPSLLDPLYTAALEHLLKIDLAKSTLLARICRYDAGCWMKPHTDRVDRLVTQIIYLSPRWPASWGGGLKILRSGDEADVYAEVHPEFNTSVAFVRSERSYHAVAPVSAAAEAPRLSLLLQHVRSA
jgi:hypothetical protein